MAESPRFLLTLDGEGVEMSDMEAGLDFRWGGRFADAELAATALHFQREVVPLLYHSHAFQRALRGRAAGTDFWTWRDGMLEEADRATPASVRRDYVPVYREMLEGYFCSIPDLYFDIRLLISEPPRVASRLRFDCTPKGILFGLPVNGKRVSFTENVFYEFRNERIEKVWSVIDKAAIESQL